MYGLSKSFEAEQIAKFMSVIILLDRGIIGESTTANPEGLPKNESGYCRERCSSTM